MKHRGHCALERNLQEPVQSKSGSYTGREGGWWGDITAVVVNSSYSAGATFLNDLLDALRRVWWSAT